MAVLEPIGVTVRPQQMDDQSVDVSVRLLASADARAVGTAVPELPLEEIPASTACSDTGEQRAGEVSSSFGVGGDVAVEAPRVLLLGEPAVVGARGPWIPVSEAKPRR